MSSSLFALTKSEYSEVFDCQLSLLEAYICGRCDYASHILACFRLHLRSNHNSVENNSKSYKCKLCTFRTFSLLLWLRHRSKNCRTKMTEEILCKRLVDNSALKRIKLDRTNKLYSKCENWKLLRRIVELEKQLQASEERCTKLETLNFELQEVVLKRWKDVMLNNVHHNQQSNDYFPIEIPVGARTNGQIHIGRDVWLPEFQYDAVNFKAVQHSRFVRELAVLIFGSHVLANSSVTGSKSNRSKADPRPRLDAKKVMAIKDILRFRMIQKDEDPIYITQVLNSVSSIIAQKISDLNRAPRQKKANNYTCTVSKSEDTVSPLEDEIAYREKALQDTR